MKSLNIAVIGECMVELQKKEGQLKQSFGGDTLNTALYLSRLTKAHDIKTSYVTALGNDPFSQEMLSAWQEEGIDTSLVLSVKERQPGIYYIETDETGERYFHYWRNEAAAKFLFEQNESPLLVDKLYSYDAVYLSGITLAILTEEGKTQLFGFLERLRHKVVRLFSITTTVLNCGKAARMPCLGTLRSLSTQISHCSHLKMSKCFTVTSI